MARPVRDDRRPTTRPEGPAERNSDGDVLVAGQRIPLRPRARRVLQYLATNPNRVVSGDELLAALWPGVAVTPHVVATLISLIRAALRDANSPCRIQTEYGRGYQLVVPDLNPSETPSLPEDPITDRDDAPAPQPVVCIGRKREFERLMEAWREASSGQARVVLVGGEAGIGKSTLVRAFAHRVAEDGGALPLVGECHAPIGQREPYQALIDMLLMLQPRIGEARLAAVLRRSAPSILAQLPHLCDEDEIDRLRQQLGGSQPRRVRIELLEAWKELAKPLPLLLVLENVQAADPHTLDFIGALATAGGDVPLLLVCTYRTLEVPTSVAEFNDLHSRVGKAPAGLEIDVCPWEASDLSNYLHARFTTDFGAAFVTALEGQSRGNPLLVRGVLDAMVFNEILRCEAGAWRCDRAPELSLAGMSREIRELLAEQLEPLSRSDRRLLEAAAVLGSSFFAADVAAVADQEEDEADDRLSDLDEIGLFIERTPVLDERGDYSFRHACYREAILADLTAGRARRLFRKAGERLEGSSVACPGDREIAERFAAARAWGKAAEHWERAAARAVQRYAYSEAVEALERSTEAVGQLSPGETTSRRLAERLLDLGNVAILAEGYVSDRPRSAFERSRAVAARCDATDLVVRACAGELILASFAGDATAAHTHGVALKSMTASLPEWRSLAHLYASYAAYGAGDFPGMLAEVELGQEYLSVAKPGYPAIRDLATSLRSINCVAWSMLRGTEECWPALRDLAATLPVKPIEDMHTLYVLARCAALHGLREESERWAVLCSEQADRLGDFEFRLRAAALAALAAAARSGASLDDARAAVEACDHDCAPFDVELFWILLAEVLVGGDDLGDAAAAIERALAFGHRPYEAEAWRVLGDVIRAAERSGMRLFRGAPAGSALAKRPTARTCYRRAEAIAQRQQAAPFLERVRDAIVAARSEE